MNRLPTLVAAALCMSLAVPAFAGGGTCTADTQSCLDHMSAKMANKGYMGLEFDKGSDHGQYVVKRVIEGTPAETAGFKPGDEILVVNGAKWSDEKEMKKVDWSVGSQLTVKVRRGNQEKALKVTLAKMPEDLVERIIGAHMLENHVAVATAKN